MFGALLRHYRERAGLSQEGLGQKIGFSKSQVAMVERGVRPPRGDFVARAEDALRAQGALAAAAAELRGGHLPQWTREYTEEEAQAASVHWYENHVVPGLLQTKAYARAVFDCHCPPLDDEEIEPRVQTRLHRQRIFDRRPAPVVSFVLELIALTRPLGGATVLKEQLGHLLDVSRRRNVEIQVMPPDRRSHAALNGPMVLLETGERRQLAYIEGQSGGFFVSQQPELSDLFARYGILRAQALSPEESAKLIEQVAREL
ncbi:helix-turn-helix domain-containing protein [Streptomyces sp. NBC_00385]|uniref:helix-turn-helix domain-containing protein n=1 Tax=Streptomyces sp. NBC_00385 TaxID=2975733 RepID=UPI002DD9C2CE|nr:helix-turn-helix transcriptional regulator [Streptomyces sp. NBC_00385]WRZ09013.1 helix-turn-helix transcriptional regulator [Streptomyces sp. NBC_00385]